MIYRCDEKQMSCKMDGFLLAHGALFEGELASYRVVAILEYMKISGTRKSANISI